MYATFYRALGSQVYGLLSWTCELKEKNFTFPISFARAVNAGVNFIWGLAMILYSE